jgi:uncharacterized protein (TIGR00369 family)
MRGVSKQAETFLEDLLGEVPEPPPVQEQLGAHLETVDEGSATFEMEAGEAFHNLVDVVHGGVLTSLAELSASTAILTTLDDDEAFTFVSQSTNHVRPVVDALVQAEAEVVRRGDRISFIEVTLTNSADREVARSEYTALVQTVDR